MITLLDVEKLFFIFLFYSLCGWTIETTGEIIKSKKFVNRGFLIGPICPVYGCGATAITILLSRYSDDVFAIMGLSAILCGFLEYFTSYLMEKIFNARWWDYSNEKFNINGRICLDTLVLFAMAGVAIILVVNPLLDRLICMIPENILNIIFYVFLGILVADIIFSFVIITSIRKISDKVKSESKDNTEEISSKVRAIILEKSAPYRRVLEAFPHVFADKVKSSKDKLVQVASDIKTNVIEAKDKTIENINLVKDKTVENVMAVKDKAVESMSNIKEKASTNIKGFRTNLALKTSNNLDEHRRINIIKSLREFKLVTITKKDKKEGNNNENKNM